ncbi:MAG: hypothetical protein EOO61_02755 [Hymenobacter sp.]|nr:MAG: hypothetical protein EOO61_02755 [Hymenobacter sp.]
MTNHTILSISGISGADVVVWGVMVGLPLLWLIRRVMTSENRPVAALKGVALVTFLVWGFNKFTGGTSSETASNEPSKAMSDYVNKTHRCTWCRREYSGGGYIHVLDGCEPAAGAFADIDNQCSEKCCYESWNAGRR